MLGAVLFGHQQMQTAIKAIKELQAEAGKPRWKWEPPAANAEVASAVALHAQAAVSKAYAITEKLKRRDQLAEIEAQTLLALAGGEFDADAMEHAQAAVFRGDRRAWQIVFAHQIGGLENGLAHGATILSRG